MPNAPDRFQVPTHLNDTQCVAYLDGEMQRGEYEAARAHLESCWTCRSRMSAVEACIENFVQAHKTLLPEPPPFSESHVEQFRQRLERHAAAEAPASSISERISEGWNQRTGWFRNLASSISQYRRPVIAGLLVACLVVVMFTDVLNTRVSADTVLVRAESYEATLSPSPEQVSRASVRVDRIDGSNRPTQLGTITVVRDSATPLLYVSASSLSGKSENATLDAGNALRAPLLDTIFSNDSVDRAIVQYMVEQRWVPDTSAPGFRRLVAGRGTSEAFARKDGSNFELRYPFAPGHPSRISEARLEVSASNYSPSSLSIVAGDQSSSREYRFTRVSYQSEPRMLAHLGGPGDGSTGHSSAAGGFSPRRPVPLHYANSRASEQEVAIAEALHKLDACLGEEINLFPMSDGSLLVQGLVDSVARRDALRLALRTVPGTLRVEVFVPRELKNGSELFRPPDQLAEGVEPSGAGGDTTTLADFSSAKMPLHDALFQHFSRPGVSSEDTEKQVAIFSNEVVTKARQTFLHAWALKKLDREFTRERTAGLSSSSLAQIDAMRQDHRRWLSTLARRQSEMLQEIAGRAAASAAEVANDQQDTDSLLRLAREQSDLVRSLFTISQQAPETPASLARLLAVLRRMGA